MPNRDGARKRTRFRDGRPPLTIGVAPTIRLSEEYGAVESPAAWAAGRAAPDIGRARLPKPVARRPSAVQVSYLSATQSIVPYMTRGGPLVAPLAGGPTFRRRLRRRCLLLLIAACVCFALTFYSPVALVAAVVCAAVATLELRSGWARLSPSAHGMAAAAFALSAAAVVMWAAEWLLRNGRMWPWR
ncbi:hypothetical protein HN371_18350 [Candidatus Poribacteria bacterium]|jgi:hypothetical protein|nr:hypothetical protein [Candidatus Poribacteria bacterium]MBT5536361.1 hypothetical protein [Candidatus Poribacteria bacterium]MBT5711737.1 hypothetical protein [Candidatus Poribacteria bacterium]MBT7809331.1 hypothetical protein [Candidatus Poribacteria bacterium]